MARRCIGSCMFRSERGNVRPATPLLDRSGGPQTSAQNVMSFRDVAQLLEVLGACLGELQAPHEKS